MFACQVNCGYEENSAYRLTATCMWLVLMSYVNTFLPRLEQLRLEQQSEFIILTFNKAEHRVRKVTSMYETDCPPIILVANKTDKEPVKDARTRLQKMARDLEVPIVWTSAFTGDGIDDLKDRIYSVTPTTQENNPKRCCTLL